MKRFSLMSKAVQHLDLTRYGNFSYDFQLSKDGRIFTKRMLLTDYYCLLLASCSLNTKAGLPGPAPGQLTPCCHRCLPKLYNPHLYSEE
ncbi:UNVERIFIED_CONTAM: hypothetical protein K2H54_017766, partial [Gekko kuhli]